MLEKTEKLKGILPLIKKEFELQSKADILEIIEEKYDCNFKFIVEESTDCDMGESVNILRERFKSMSESIDTIGGVLDFVDSDLKFIDISEGFELTICKTAGALVEKYDESYPKTEEEEKQYDPEEDNSFIVELMEAYAVGCDWCTFRYDTKEDVVTISTPNTFNSFKSNAEITFKLTDLTDDKLMAEKIYESMSNLIKEM